MRIKMNTTPFYTTILWWSKGRSTYRIVHGPCIGVIPGKRHWFQMTMQLQRWHSYQKWTYLLEFISNPRENKLAIVNNFFFSSRAVQSPRGALTPKRKYKIISVEFLSNLNVKPSYWLSGDGSGAGNCDAFKDARKTEQLVQTSCTANVLKLPTNYTDHYLVWPMPHVMPDTQRGTISSTGWSKQCQDFSEERQSRKQDFR